ncbi:MAG: 2-phospho-L-lactate transferase [Actinobacteria bacterium]|nr:2-phospho-L-lactate transferase [Actinomycetota bacterium]
MKVVALAGGVGAARFLRGLVRVVEPADVTVVVNTGDDLVLHGLHISPDLDTVTYTLGGGVHPEQGWGRAGDTLTVAAELRDRYGAPDWFTLGDRDLATHLVRTRILAEGGTLSRATAVIAGAWELAPTLLPMTDDPVTTRVRTADGRDLHFQRWWVGEGAEPAVAEVVVAGAAEATPAPGVLEAVGAADVVVLCPSNPVVSIGPILAVPGLRRAVAARPVVGVSPIVGGRDVRGMADRLLPAIGCEVSADAVAGLYADLLDGWVVDRRDAGLADAVAALGCRVATTESIMTTPQVAASLARTALELVAGPRRARAC